MSRDNLDRASMEDFRNMAAALADAEARLAAVQRLLSETVWVGCDEDEPEEEYVYADDLRAIFAGTPPGGFNP